MNSFRMFLNQMDWLLLIFSSDRKCFGRCLCAEFVHFPNSKVFGLQQKEAFVPQKLKLCSLDASSHKHLPDLHSCFLLNWESRTLTVPAAQNSNHKLNEALAVEARGDSPPTSISPSSWRAAGSPHTETLGRRIQAGKLTKSLAVGAGSESQSELQHHLWEQTNTRQMAGKGKAASSETTVSKTTFTLPIAKKVKRNTSPVAFLIPSLWWSGLWHFSRLGCRTLEMETSQNHMSCSRNGDFSQCGSLIERRICICQTEQSVGNKNPVPIKV